MTPLSAVATPPPCTGFNGALDEIAVYADVLPTQFLLLRMRYGLAATNLAVLNTNIAGISGGCRVVNSIMPDFVNSNCLVLLAKAQTAVLLSVTPNLGVVGDVLTVHGSNFIADVNLMHVLVAGVRVPTLSATTSTVTFAMPELAGQRGPMVVTLVVVGVGEAIGALTVSSQVRVQQVSPIEGSIGGGTLLTLTGTGFSPIVGTTRVYLGVGLNASTAATGVPCDLVSTFTPTATTVKCITRATTPTVFGVYVDVTPVAGSTGTPTFAGLTCLTSLSCVFETTLRVTPVVTGLANPVAVAGTRITVVGTGYV